MTRPPSSAVMDRPDGADAVQKGAHLLLRPLGGQGDLVGGEQAALQLVGRAEGRQLPVGDHEDLVADGLHLGQDVGAEQNCMGLAQLPDELPDLNDLEGVQPHRGLIQNDDSGAAQQRLGNAHPLAVALGESGDAAAANPLQAGLLDDLP